MGERLLLLMGDLERDLDFLSSFNSERLLHRVKNDYCIKNDFLNNNLKEIKKFCFQNQEQIS